MLLSPYRVKQRCYGTIFFVVSRTCSEIPRLSSAYGGGLLAGVTYIPRRSAVSSLAPLPYDRRRFLAVVTYTEFLAALTYRVHHARDACFKRLEVDRSAISPLSTRCFHYEPSFRAKQMASLAGLLAGLQPAKAA